ncbi:RibD family protein [Calothrix rhizosoleniae]|uniref:RibD family protein n=1 Tax=Calothrix rhizosoleniae TaxID=888997 RepID=UPI000B49F68C|nr:RibD family protein [Calothrix rhizosoleniae]
MFNRPHTTVVLAMSADGKIADFMRSPARFGSQTDKMHLQQRIAAADAVLFGAGTLRAYNTTLTISNPKLLQQREQRGQPLQPIHIVVSKSAQIDPESRFFSQPVPRWLLTSSMGADVWKQCQVIDNSSQITFDKILVLETRMGKIDIAAALTHLATLGIAHLAVLGGGILVGEMMELDLIDELWLTICPLILGGKTAPTPVEGQGFLSQLAPRLELLTINQVEQEVFLNYRVRKRQGSREQGSRE